jgi:hypothetical protein
MSKNDWDWTDTLAVVGGSLLVGAAVVAAADEDYTPCYTPRRTYVAGVGFVTESQARSIRRERDRARAEREFARLEGERRAYQRQLRLEAELSYNRRMRRALGLDD